MYSREDRIPPNFTFNIKIALTFLQIATSFSFLAGAVLFAVSVAAGLLADLVVPALSASHRIDC